MEYSYITVKKQCKQNNIIEGFKPLIVLLCANYFNSYIIWINQMFHWIYLTKYKYLTYHEITSKRNYSSCNYTSY